MSAAEERKKQVCLVIMRPDVKVEDDIDIVEVNCHAGDHLSLNQKKTAKTSSTVKKQALIFKYVCRQSHLIFREGVKNFFLVPIKFVDSLQGSFSIQKIIFQEIIVQPSRLIK